MSLGRLSFGQKVFFVKGCGFLANPSRQEPRGGNSYKSFDSSNFEGLGTNE